MSKPTGKKEKNDFSVSCIAIDDNGKQAFGRIVYQDEKQIYFIANDAGYLLDTNFKVLKKTIFTRRPLVDAE